MVSCSGAVVWNFCVSSSCKPLLLIISRFSSDFPSDKILGYKNWRKWSAWHILFSRVFRGRRCTKFEENQTNLKRVKLPTDSSVSSGDLSPDVTWRQTDVRRDVTRKSSHLPPHPSPVTNLFSLIHFPVLRYHRPPINQVCMRVSFFFHLSKCPS